MDWHKRSASQVIDELNTNIEIGLTESDARNRLQKYGPNELIERGRKRVLQIILDQFRDLMVIILILAAIVSAILGEYVDVAVILAIVILNAVLGFTQEYRAEQTMAELKKLAVPIVKVRRDEHLKEISSRLLVPGDIILLEAGNMVPADARLIENVNLKTQESALTGESEPVEKQTEELTGDNLPVGDRVNMLFMGTVITYGRGTAVVTQTGMETELGKIADLIQEVEQEKTPLQRRLDQLSKILAGIALVIILLVVITGWRSGVEFEILILTGVSLAVAVIPESLPAVVTITLALGSQRLLKRNALIRKLPAVETLGSVTTICSDKTGTLTENRMTVTILDIAGHTEDLETLIDRKESLLRARLYSTETPAKLIVLSVLVRAGALCNDAILEIDDQGEVRAIGDPTEGALVLAAYQLGFKKPELDKEWPRVDEVPFTSERKRMTTIHKTSAELAKSDLPWKDAPYTAISKGAVDNLLSTTKYVLLEDQVLPMDDDLRERIAQANTQFASQGQRVLGVTFRPWEEQELPEDNSLLENEQVFLGLIAMMDPPRPEVRESVKIARTAGIRSVMITGDHPLTAIQIAKDLTIAQGDGFLTGQELEGMSISELESVVEDISVYARVSPAHKLKIVEALQNKGEIVAMTGDGVNDAPALKKADIGVAMGITGTDVSKEASDLVLLDDNFTTIVIAVEQGRIIFDNIRKFIKYTLSSNTGEMFLMLVGPLLKMPLPLMPLQILWINLVTDGLPGLALSEETGERDTMERPPFDPRKGIFSGGLGAQIIWIGVLMGIVSLVIGYIYWQNDPTGPWQTMIFTTLVLAQMGNALSIRSFRDSFFSIGPLKNRLMVFAVLLTFILQLVLLYVPFFQRVFRTDPLSIENLLICLGASTIVFTAGEISKWISRLRRARTLA
jgi:P-type Ca2+ transporter type 2C